MIEIITESVVMPTPCKCRFIKHSIDYGKKWQVLDTQKDKAVIYKGNFENVAIASHNLNKKYYKEIADLINNGWAIAKDIKPIPDRNHDYDYWHVDGEEKYSCASMDECIAEIKERLEDD